jgi:type I restriction enzyme S subunit
LSYFKFKLGDIAAPGRSVISGPFGSNIGKRVFQKYGGPVIRGNNLTTNFIKFIDDGFVYLTEEKANELKSDAIKEDILFTAAGTIGQVGIIPPSSKFKRYVISNKQLRFRVNINKADPNYVYYWLASPWIFKLILKKNTGSTVPLINLGVIKTLPITLPKSLYEQKKIANVLSVLDDKIELNNRINAELEAMAKTLYDYWFVQFDFPDANGKPYKSSGGKMVYNETLKREIPEGWGVTTIGDFESNIITGKTPSKIIDEYFNGNIPFITIGDIRENTFIVNTEETLTKSGAESQKNKYLPAGSICVTCIATPGLVGFVTTESQTNQQINSIICKKSFSKYFLYFTIKQYFSHSTAKTGNTFANMNKKDFSDILLMSCPEQNLISFNNKVKFIFESIRLKSQENQTLKTLRDWLLPMLMNGQVKVK